MNNKDRRGHDYVVKVKLSRQTDRRIVNISNILVVHFQTEPEGGNFVIFILAKR